MSRKVSVLHLSTTDIRGGSAKSAQKIHEGIRALGLESRMLVGRKHGSDPEVDVLSKGMLRLADEVALKATSLLSLQYAFVPSTPTLLRHPWFRAADVVQIYNTHGNWFAHSVLPRLTAEKPTVWRLSDMWPMTGHCAYAGTCENWKTGCGSCPDLKTYPALRRDTTRQLWERKRRLYGRSRLRIVAPSRWILDLAERSPLLAPFPKQLIPNGIDTQAFRPLDRAACRARLGIPADRKTLLFLASDVADRNKGTDLFLEAVNALWDAGRRDILVLAAGRNAASLAARGKAPFWSREHVADSATLADIYNSADVYAHAATRENLPNSLLEALACGTPAAAFDSGGVAEVVRPGSTGLLVPGGDVAAFRDGLDRLIGADAGATASGDACRDLILRDYTLEGQARTFADLYASLARPGQA